MTDTTETHPCSRCGGAEKSGRHGVDHKQVYSRALYDAAAAEWNAAREAEAAAHKAWALCNDRMRAAESALCDQEVQTGIPGYQHLETVTARGACRLEYCQIHDSNADERPF